MMYLFQAGGPFFMSLLTVLLLIVLAISTLYAKAVFAGQLNDQFTRRLGVIKSVGLLAMVLGVFAQAIGLYQILTGIESIQQVSPAMLAGGLKVSMITTLYGVFIFLISYVIWLGLKSKAMKQLSH